MPGSEDIQNDIQTRILAALTDIKKHMWDQRQPSAYVLTQEESEENVSESDEEEAAGAAAAPQGIDGNVATPGSLRLNIQLMALAAGRIAQLRGDDREDEDELVLPRTKAQGKKSGSLLVATDNVKHTIDWPHMHVRRIVNGRRKNLNYSELRVEEFVFGFLTMLENPISKMDSSIMIPLLRMLMQDAMDYSWANALNFYDTLGVKVEHGALQWHDTELIREYIMTYSRAVFPEKKEEKKEGGKTQPRQAPPGTRLCAAFQKHTCELNRDHATFTHACAYCWRTCNLLGKHPEND